MFHRRSKQKPLVIAIGYGLLMSIAGSAAAEGIEEITVTAQKREENLQTTPIAISAMTGDTLKNMGVTSMEGVAKASPSISFTPYPSSSNILIMYMRGQGVSDPMQITSDGSVGMYTDGFYLSRPQASTFDLADIERVEVLRGPQGTLYGRNTTGGAVNLISKKPTGEFGFKQDFSFGTRNLFRSLTTVDLPKIGDVSAKVSFLKSSKDGLVKNPGSSHDFGEESQQAGRLSLRWEASDNVTVDYFMDKGTLDSTPMYYQNPRWSGQTIEIHPDLPYGGFHPYHKDGSKRQSTAYRSFDLKESTSDSEGHGLTVTWDVNENLTIKSLTGYRKLYWQAYQDYGDAFDIGDYQTGVPNSYRTDDYVNDHQFSQEVQFIGSALDNQIKYVAGLYYFEEGGSHYEGQNVGFNDPRPDALAPGSNHYVYDRYVSAESKSKAIYGQVTYTPPILENRLDVTVGARFTKDDRSAERTFFQNGTLVENGKQPVLTPNPYNHNLPFSPNGSANDQSFSRFNPSLTVNFNWTDDLSTYAKVSTGYKAGGSSESGPVGNFGETTFSPEKVISYEIGEKAYFWDRRVRLNAAAFLSKFDDMQLAFVADPFNNGVIQSMNAGKATVKGLEVELLVQPIDDLSLSMDYAWLQPNFDEVKAPAGTLFTLPGLSGTAPYAVGAEIKNLLVMPYAPKNTINLAADYTFFKFDKGDIAAHLDYRYQSDVYVTASAGPAVLNRDYYKVSGYGLLNGRVTLTMDLPRGDQAKVALWGKNLANKQYLVHSTGNGGPIDGFVSAAESWGEPASYGVDVSYRY